MSMDVDKLVEMHRQGYDQATIAANLGVERSTVSRWLGELGMRKPKTRRDAIAASSFRAADVVMPPQRGLVYFVTSGDLVKIGYTLGEWRTRLGNMRVANPALEVLVVVEAADAPAAERRLHERFIASLETGEWYHHTPELDGLISHLRSLQADVETALAG